MPWNPDVYNKFKEERYQPFYDLISHIHAKPDMRIIDLGCGTGELTKVIADKVSAKYVLGIDNSAEMLGKVPKQDNISFAQTSIEEQLERDEKWDLILANASLQWANDHPALFAKLVSRLSPDGQLAVQMPSQKENMLNQILYKLVHEKPYYEALHGEIRHSPVLSLDEYTSLLYANGAKETLIYQKVYPIIAQSIEILYEFISGSALVPYMAKLDDSIKPDFEKAFKGRIAAYFTSSPMVYAFKRILLIARF